MKRITVIAIIIAVLLIGAFAASTFYRSNPPSPAFNLIGEWQPDSLSVSDSSSRVMKDNISYHFLADSTLQKISAKDSTTEKYYLKDSVLYVDEGKGYWPYSFKKISDSLIQLQSTDSVLLTLKRK